jgi:DNA recombination protein RmuC
MNELGKKIDTTRRSYDAAMNKLQLGRGNLISRAETLRELGARASKKQIPDRLEQARQSDPDREVE